MTVNVESLHYRLKGTVHPKNTCFFLLSVMFVIHCCDVSCRVSGILAVEMTEM